MEYGKSSNYTDYRKIYRQCSGPGGLKLAEYMAEKMGVTSGAKLIDIGFNRGYQTCFLAKEYGVSIVGIDPWDDRETGVSHIECLMENARDFGVSDQILGVKSGVPETLLPSNCFDYAYSTTCLEMIRGMEGPEAYLSALKEIHRVLKKGGVLGLGEPMHFDAPVPEDLAPLVAKIGWEKFFATLEETKKAVQAAGFTVLQADYSEDAEIWWKEYAEHDPFCAVNPEENNLIQNNRSRWLSFGICIAAK